MAERKASTSSEVNVRKAVPIKSSSTLTHYTDLAGFQGIVEKGEFWLSNAAFLNDPQELEHGIEQTRRVIRRLLAQEADEDPTAKARRNLIKDMAADLEQFRRPDAYIACFCERDDLLSQWRGYASRQGVSVSFRTAGLRKSFRDLDVELQQVAYGINETKRHLRQALKDELPDVVDDLNYMIGSDQDDKIRKKFQDLVATLVPRFKHYGFREEREWRLIVRNPSTNKLFFRPRGQLMLPFLKLKSTKPQLPISRVTIGPGVNDEAVLKSLKFFLEVNEYDPDLARRSLTPYRT